MAQLPPVKRFILEDYAGIKEIPDFCTKFFYPLNLFLNATYAALSNGLTLAANSIGSVSTGVLVTSDANGQAKTTINWKYPQTPPQGVLIMACTVGGNAAQAPLLSWSYSAGVITLSMQFVKVTTGSLVVYPSTAFSVTVWANGG